MILTFESAFKYGQTVKINTVGVVIPAIVEQIQTHSNDKEYKIYYHLRSAKEYNQNGKMQPYHYGPVSESDLLEYQSLEYGVQEK